MLSFASHSCYLISQKEPANPLCEIVMHYGCYPGCYALSPAASLTFLRCLDTIILLSCIASKICLIFFANVQKGGEFGILIVYIGRGSMELK